LTAWDWRGENRKGSKGFEYCVFEMIELKKKPEVNEVTSSLQTRREGLIIG
jgi:hypothetical protein